jgi:hypothetical protein
MAAKNEKKVPAPKPAKVAKPKAKAKKNNVDVQALTGAKFVSFKVRAVIPVQQYGNIQPEIEVFAPTYELAVAFAMPKIEELWKTYAERPINGNLPRFVGPVSVEEKTVVPVLVPKEEPVAPVSSPSSTVASEVSEASVPSSTSTTTEKQFSEAGQKAKKMIELAVTRAALNLVEDKVKNSIKIPEEEKPFLYTIILKKIKTI